MMKTSRRNILKSLLIAPLALLLPKPKAGQELEIACDTVSSSSADSTTYGFYVFDDNGIAHLVIPIDIEGLTVAAQQQWMESYRYAEGQQWPERKTENG
jgi:hypothetical protein